MVAMKFIPVASLLVCAACISGAVGAQPRAYPGPHRARPSIEGDWRVNIVLPADGKLPYTAAARKELAGPPSSEPLDNPEQRSNAERCLVGQGQPPLSSFLLDSQIQILRTRDHVVIHVEYGDDVRIIRLTKKHGPKMFWSPLGDSIAHWERET